MAVKLVGSLLLSVTVGSRIPRTKSSDSQDKAPFPLVLGGHTGFPLKSALRPAELGTLRQQAVLSNWLDPSLGRYYAILVLSKGQLGTERQLRPGPSNRSQMPS